MYRKILLPALLFIYVSSFAQQPTIKILQSGKKVSLRGLSVVSDDIVWASGSGGTVAKSLDGGNTWEWLTVPGYEKRDFRDIEAFDEYTAIIMGIAEPAVILKTIDGGKNWKKVFEDTAKYMFFDAMDFNGKKEGIVVGDPINGLIYFAFTNDYGNSWKHKEIGGNANMFPVKEGEAFFASSGTNIKILPNRSILLVSGGISSKLFGNGHKDSLPIIQGKESTGANSIAVHNGKKAVIVGGDFTKDTISNNNCVLFDVADKIHFKKPKTPPHGYRSCVIYLNKKKLVTCGTSGIDISNDGGNNWELISKESFHVCQKSKKGKAVFLAGGGGRIAKLIM